MNIDLDRSRRNGTTTHLVKLSPTVLRIDQTVDRRMTRGDRLAVTLLFGGLVLAILIFAFVRIGLPLIRHFTGGTFP